MKLITEVNEQLNILVEDAGSGKGKKYFIEGVFLQGNIRNRNGRIYPSAVLNEKVTDYVTNFVKENRAYGELGHPSNPAINLERISHIIKDLHLDGDNWMGKAELMDTPMGKIAKSILDAGGKIGVSSRALGSLIQKEGHDEVQGDLHLVTAADIVADPSAPDAFVRGIMEDKEWICEGGIFKAITPKQQAVVAEARMTVNDIIKNTPVDRQLREEAFVRLFYDFMSKIVKE